VICAKCGRREATEKMLHIVDAIAGSSAPTGQYYEDWCHRCAEKLRKKAASNPDAKFVQQQRAAGVPFDVIEKELQKRFEERWRKHRRWRFIAFWRW
jgi:hypothetical protein